MEEIHNIIQNFENNKVQNWRHYEHIIICIYYAYRAENHDFLFSQMRCALIRYRALTDEKSTVASCMEKYNETRTWFWSLIVFKLVNENRELSILEILEIAEKLGYLNNEYILNYYSSEELKDPKNKIFVLQKTIQ